MSANQNQPTQAEKKKYVCIEFDDKIVVAMKGADFEVCMIEQSCLDLRFPLSFEIVTEVLPQSQKNPEGGIKQTFKCVIPPGIMPPEKYYSSTVDHTEYDENHTLVRAYLDNLTKLQDMLNPNKRMVEFALGYTK